MRNIEMKKQQTDFCIHNMSQAGLSLTWSETPKSGFLVTRFINYQ